MSHAAPDSPPKKRVDRRTAARIAAVQALYQRDMSDDSTIDDIIAEFTEYHPRVENDEAPPLKVDPTLFADITRGAADRLEEVDVLITTALVDGWTIDRLEALLRAVLRAGTFELLARPETPAKVIINQYIDVAHAFFGRGEPGFVNGVLDRLAHRLRAGELTSAPEPAAKETG